MAISGLVAYFLAPYLMAFIFPAFAKSSSFGELIGLTRILLLSPIFLGFSNLLASITQVSRRFFIYALSPVLYNIGIIIGIVFFYPIFGLYGLGFGVILGAFLHMIMQVPLAWKMGFRPKLIIDFKSVALRKLFRMMPPRVLTIGISELQNLGLGFFATTIGGLSFVVIRLGMRLMTIPIRLFGVPISQASLPFLAQETGEEEHQRFNSLVIQSLHQIS